MEIWYIPLTIIPGVGLLIMSTANIQNALSAELSQLINEDCEKFHHIIELKISQLDLLNRALVALYFTAACYILASLIIGLSETTEIISPTYYKGMIYLGIISVLTALILMSIVSIRAVSIKKKRFKASFEKEAVKSS